MVGQLNKITIPKDNAIYQIVDRVLEGQSESIKSKVWYLVNKKNIDPDDEFLLIFIALGHLEVLIEEAPKEWQNALSLYKSEFSEILGEYRQIINSNNQKLELWSQNNLNVLEQIAKKVETMETLAKSSQELSKSAAELLAVCGDLSAKLGTSSSESGKSLVKLKELSSNFESAIEEMPKLPKKIVESLEAKLDLSLDQILAKKNLANSNSNKYLPLVQILISGVCLFSIWGINSNVSSQIAEMKFGLQEFHNRFVDGQTKAQSQRDKLTELLYLGNTAPGLSKTRSNATAHLNSSTEIQLLFLKLYQKCLEHGKATQECQKLIEK